MERADFSHERHKAWTHSTFHKKKPSEVFQEHFMTCFIDDLFGLKNLADVGEDNVAYECDYPHSDALWPEVPEYLWEGLKRLTDTQIDKVTHQNALNWLHHDMFSYRQRHELSVGALRAQAKADQVDTTPISSGGAAPLAEGEEKRPVTSGDIFRMMAKQSEVA